MCILNSLIEDMCATLTGVRSHDHNIIRVHTRKLEELGDLSFPLDTKNWYRFIDKGYTENKNTIFECLLCQEELQEKSRMWHLSIQSIAINNGNVAIYLNKEKAFRVVINSVMNQTTRYGSENCLNRYVSVRMAATDYALINLTSLKIHLLQIVVSKIAMFLNPGVRDEVLTLEFTSGRSSRIGNHCCISCGPVLNERYSKDLCTTAQQLYDKRTVDMRQMAVHKYGVRATSQPAWKEFFEKLGKAAVTIHFTQNKPQHTTMVKLNDPESIRGASFILYNCARLATLLKEFDKKVAAHVYPSLPELHDMEFNLLIEPEEWELLFVYILRFPVVVTNCISHIEKLQVSPHFLVSHLSGLASTFSVYYRRIRILTEPRDHLFPVLHQRVYLLKALQYVLHNALYLLDIQPVKQM